MYLDSLDAYKNAFLAEHEKVKSWRVVVDNKPYKIYPNMARLIAKGYDPGNKIRRILHLPDKQAVEVCHCGVAHTTKRCTSSNHRPRPPRIAIRLDNPESAARSIQKHMDPELMAELVELLK